MGTLLLSLTPTVSAALYEEGFEQFSAGEQDPESVNFTFTQDGANSFVSTAQAHQGNKSLKYEGVSSTNHATMTTANGICQGSGDVWVYMAAYPDATDAFQLFWDNGNTGATPAAGYLLVSINDAGAISVVIEGDSGGVTDTDTIPAVFPLATWVDFQFSAVCATSQGFVFSSVLDAGISVDAPGSITELTTFTIRETDPDGGHVAYIDDVVWNDGPFGGQADRFCANPDEDNFGYDYVEGVEFNDDIFTAGISLEDAFVFEGDSGNSEYLAKGYDPGSEAFLVRARLEASGEGASSKFRIGFTTGATVLTAGSGADLTTDLAAASDGEDGGNFDNHVQIIFIENSNSWGISAWYNVAGAGLTQIAGALNYGANPNSPTTFQVVVNSGTTDLPTSVDNHTIPDIGDNVISVQDGDGNIIFQWQLPAGLFNAEWKDQWFIGKGTGIANAFTYLDDTDQLQDDDSTCLWDLLGTGTRTGSAGLAPGSTIINPPDEGEGGGFSSLFDPDNIDSQLFIGFLLVAGMVFIGVRQGVGQAAIGALFFVGLFLGYSLGWVPLWVILVIFTASLAAIFVLPRQSKDGV